MKKVIHYVRKQPEETRRHILHILTACFAVILFILWVYSFGASLSSEDTQAELREDAEPFSVLRDNVPPLW